MVKIMTERMIEENKLRAKKSELELVRLERDIVKEKKRLQRKEPDESHLNWMILWFWDFMNNSQVESSSGIKLDIARAQ
jgi:hypothetical protein